MHQLTPNPLVAAFFCVIHLNHLMSVLQTGSHMDFIFKIIIRFRCWWGGLSLHGSIYVWMTDIKINLKEEKTQL